MMLLPSIHVEDAEGIKTFHLLSYKINTGWHFTLGCSYTLQK